MLERMTIPSAAPPIDNGNVADVIRRAQAGDRDAFEIVYREHAPRVYALCLRLSGGTQSEASELMQDVFIRAWRGLPAFRGDSAFSSWLHRLTINAMLESRRSDSRRSARILFVEEPEESTSAMTHDSPELQLDLERAIAGLPDGARMAFVLHEIEGYQHSEIATQLGIAEGTVKAQLHRARKLLIEALNR
jgi:RNA polymerase sigma-70 factor (ECF subfamily)